MTTHAITCFCRRALAAALCALALTLPCLPARADVLGGSDDDTVAAAAASVSIGNAAPSGSDANPAPEETWSVHGQFTSVAQWHPAFHAPYSGANSLTPGSASDETADLTLFLGRRLWHGGELYLNPEIDQGFGLGNTLGVAGFPSGEAYKVGSNTPYFRLQRAFVRQVIALDGPEQVVAPGPNQLGGRVPVNNLTLTVGKFSVVDLFDSNRYAHDPRADFLNWTTIDSGAFDYAADAWGYTVGAALEWNQSWWTLRTGLFDLSAVPNSTRLDGSFHQNEWVAEAEGRHQWLGHPGKAKLLVFVNRGNMGSYDDAVTLAQLTGGPPSTALVRRFGTRAGLAVNIEQELASDLGFFARAGLNDGSKETYEFTDVNRSLSMGLSLSGDRWGRHDDTVGLAVTVNGLSNAARNYFASGGLGLLVGDGLLHYGTERIAEAYYSWQLNPRVAVALNVQYIVNPAYNRDRGPVPVVGVRVHAAF